MTHFDDDTTHIKLEPISPPDACSLEECQGQGQGQQMVWVTPPSPLRPQPDSQLLPLDGGALWQLDSTPAASSSTATAAAAAAAAAAPAFAAVAAAVAGGGQSKGLRRALKQKIQSDRRARGQDTLVVKFEEGVKLELTEQEVKKRERRKEQNRRAAQKCRLKKRHQQQMAQRESSTLCQENQILKTENENLRSEIEYWKELLVDHVNSGSCQIPDIVQRCSPSPQTVPIHQSHEATPPPVAPSVLPHSLQSEQDLINQMAKSLEMGTSPLEFNRLGSQAKPLQSTEATGIDIDLISAYIEEQASLGDSFLDLSQSPSKRINTEVDNNSALNSCQASDAFKAPVPQPQATTKPRGVRNLTSDFAQCAVQAHRAFPSSNASSSSSSASSSSSSAADSALFAHSWSQDDQTTVTSTTTASTRPAKASPYELPAQMGQAFNFNSDLFQRGNTTLNGPDYLLSPPDAFPLPDSPESDCISPHSVTSPTFFHSSA